MRTQKHSLINTGVQGSSYPGSFFTVLLIYKQRYYNFKTTKTSSVIWPNEALEAGARFYWRYSTFISPFMV